MTFRTKREIAIDALSQAIRAGRYAPGQELRQIQLMEDLNLGSTPVRDAILELLARGVLVQESHKSVRVAELNLERLRNIYHVRELLETEAARLGSARITDDAIDQLDILLQHMHALNRSGDIAGAHQADAKFHKILYEASANPLLIQLIEQVNLTFPGSILWNIPNRIKQSLKEHKLILEAVRNRDPTRAAQAIELHLASGLATLEAHIKSYTKRESKKSHPIEKSGSRINYQQ